MRREILRRKTTCDSITLFWGTHSEIMAPYHYRISCADLQITNTEETQVTFRGLLPDFAYQIVFQAFNSQEELVVTECLTIRTQPRSQMLKLVI